MILWAIRTHRRDDTKIQKNDEKDRDDAEEGGKQLISADVLAIFPAKVIRQGRRICSNFW
jgi:hypothetical protein